jgi:hypothetical protein
MPSAPPDARAVAEDEGSVALEVPVRRPFPVTLVDVRVAVDANPLPVRPRDFPLVLTEHLYAVAAGREDGVVAVRAQAAGRVAAVGDVGRRDGRALAEGVARQVGRVEPRERGRVVNAGHGVVAGRVVEPGEQPRVERAGDGGVEPEVEDVGLVDDDEGVLRHGLPPSLFWLSCRRAAENVS